MLKRVLMSLADPLLGPLRRQRAARVNARAIGLWDRGDLPGVERLLREAVARDPGYGRARSNLGMVLWQQRRLDEAIAHLRGATEADPRYAGGWVNLGICLYMSGAVEESIDQYRVALRVDPDLPQAHLNLLMALLDTCDWDAAEIEVNSLLQRWREAPGPGVLDSISPFVSLLAPVPLEFRLQVARRYAQQVLTRTTVAARLRRPAPTRRSRLRIGYLSSDFRNHAAAYLAAGLFELHDRRRFEVRAYSTGIDDGSDYRRRLVAAFDHFTDIRDLSHVEAAQRIADDEIDILVDLNGYTEGARPEILALRPAPVQAQYLGYPGTMGGKFVDYIVADGTVIPDEDERYFTEKVARLPACYQVNDSQQGMGTAAARRDEHGLPEGFVFCCFNKHCKIERSQFDSWMRILGGSPGSVLWLPEGAGNQRLRARASRQGIDPARVVFAKVLPRPAYLSRLPLADLFLDTGTYNAHSTGSDALRAGVPVLTCPHAGFAGRVGASLLKAAGLPELIASDREDYEQRAVAWARDPAQLQTLARKLAANRSTQPLFDTARSARDLEAAYEAMWELHASGGEPRSFSAG